MSEEKYIVPLKFRLARRRFKSAPTINWKGDGTLFLLNSEDDNLIACIRKTNTTLLKSNSWQITSPIWRKKTTSEITQLKLIAGSPEFIFGNEQGDADDKLLYNVNYDTVYMFW